MPAVGRPWPSDDNDDDGDDDDDDDDGNNGYGEVGCGYDDSPITQDNFG